MEADCLARSIDGLCSVARSSIQPDAITITHSVGAGGANFPADVRTIQAALNNVAPAQGGPQPPLKVDGMVGPLTLGAIKRYQQTHVRIVDSRIDPNGPTLAALNAGGGGTVSIAAQTSVGAAPRKPEFLPPDPEIVATVLTLMFRVRDSIRAANFQCLTADPFISTDKLTVPQGPFLGGVRQSLNLFNVIFSLGKFSNPRPPFENIKRVFRNMDVALNRSFETDPLIAPILFVPNTHISMEIHAAYTAPGGAFLPPTVKFKGLPELANRIYVCRNFLTETVVDQVSALVHELAHYVSGQPIKIDDIIKKGRMLHAESRASFDAITPEQKVRSAEHYSFFAICSRFPQFLTPG